jgi:hypothetical protein
MSVNDWHLAVEVYDATTEYENIMKLYESGNKKPWDHNGDGTLEEWEEYWIKKYDGHYMRLMCEDFHPDDTVGLPAPMEHQPEWYKINVEEFIRHRMEALEKISKMDSPLIHKYHTWFVWDGDECPSGHPTANNPLDEFLGYKLYKNKVISWNKVWESDKNLYNYSLLRGRSKEKGIAPKGWHDDYLDEDEPWYSDLPGYGTSQGVYMNDGVYAHGGPELVWKSTTDEEMWEPDKYR